MPSLAPVPPKQLLERWRHWYPNCSYISPQGSNLNRIKHDRDRYHDLASLVSTQISKFPLRRSAMFIVVRFTMLPSATSGRMLCKRLGEFATVVITDPLHHFLF